jgi:hypothetical protein
MIAATLANSFWRRVVETRALPFRFERNETMRTKRNNTNPLPGQEAGDRKVERELGEREKEERG